jgi:hypothetical protein
VAAAAAAAAVVVVAEAAILLRALISAQMIQAVQSVVAVVNR